jgi:hypothetical protein
MSKTRINCNHLPLNWDEGNVPLVFLICLVCMFTTSLSSVITMNIMRKRSCVKLKLNKNYHSIKSCFLNFQSYVGLYTDSQGFTLSEVIKFCINFETKDTELTEQETVKQYQYLRITCPGF